jgi:hypothetical protein
MNRFPLFHALLALAVACSDGAVGENDATDSGELSAGAVEYSELAPVPAGKPNLLFGPPVVETEGNLEFANGDLFPPGVQEPPSGEPPPDEPEPTGVETCALSDRDLVATPIEGLGEVLVTPDAQTLILTMYSPLSKECETVGEFECGRTLTAIAASSDGKSLYLAGAVTLPDGTLPEAVVWRLDLQVKEEGGGALLAGTLVELARLPCAPTALALADMNGDGSEDFLASCQQDPPSCYETSCYETGPAWVLVKSPTGAPKAAGSLLLLSPVSGITSVAGGDIDGDELPDLAAAGGNGIAYWLQIR